MPRSRSSSATVAGLDGGAAGDERLERGGVAAEDGLRVGLQLLEQRRIEARARTSPSPPARSRSRGRGRSRACRRRTGPGRLVEGPDQVLPLGQVHRRLAPDRGVDLRRERGRDLEERHASHVGGGDEPGHVARGAAAERHDQVVAMGLLRGELVQQRGGDLERLRVLARRHGQDERMQASRAEGRLQGSGPQLRDGGVGHHERALGDPEVREHGARALEEPAPHHDVVGPPRHGDGHTLHRSSSTIAAATSPGGPVPSTTWAANSR